MILIRRTFLQVAASALGLFAAPTVVRSESLMPLRGARYWVRFATIKPIRVNQAVVSGVVGNIAGGACPQSEFLKLAKEHGGDAFDYALIPPPEPGVSLREYVHLHTLTFPKAEGVAFGGSRQELWQGPPRRPGNVSDYIDRYRTRHPTFVGLKELACA